jgi:hypothetical protein
MKPTKTILSIAAFGAATVLAMTSTATAHTAAYHMVPVGSTIPGSCSGNFFSNGNFETVTGNPDARNDQDIAVANGWSGIWSGGSQADLYTAVASGIPGKAPTPPSGVYASHWITNRNINANETVYREGMMNKLTTSLTKNLPPLTITFTTASEKILNSPVIGIYAVKYDPSTPRPATPTSAIAPANVDLFGPGNAVLIGTLTIPQTATNTWVTQKMTANLSVLGTGNYNYIMETRMDTTPVGTGLGYIAFDNFCATIPMPTTSGGGQSLPPSSEGTIAPSSLGTTSTSPQPIALTVPKGDPGRTTTVKQIPDSPRPTVASSTGPKKLGTTPTTVKRKAQQKRSRTVTTKRK